MAITVAISPMIESLLRMRTDWCSACKHPAATCICPDEPLRDDSTVLWFMQSPNDPEHGLNILESACLHQIKAVPECGSGAFSLLIAVSMLVKHRNWVGLNSEMARLSQRVRLDPVTACGYDYENQAWVEGGKYARCAHPEAMHCRCFGRLHAGENVRA